MSITKQKRLQLYYVGIDISKKIFEICVLDSKGKRYDIFQIQPNHQGFQQLLNRVPNPSTAVFGMETTGPLAGNLVSYLRKNNYQVVLSDPFHVARLRDAFTKSVKNDCIDAYVIAQGLRMNILKDSQKESRFSDLQDLLERRHDLIERLTALICQLRSNLVETFPEFEQTFTRMDGNGTLAILSACPTASDFQTMDDKTLRRIAIQANGRLWKRKLQRLRKHSENSVASKTGEIHKAIIRSQVEELKLLKTQIKDIDDLLEHCSKSFELELVLLQSLPGVQTHTSYQLLAVIGNHERFDLEGDGQGAKRLSSFVGYGLRESSSGPRKFKGGISKRGNSKLRGMLFMASMHAIKQDPDLANKYQLLKEHKGNGRKALVAISHTLLRRGYGVLKSCKKYDPTIPRKKQSHLGIPLSPSVPMKPSAAT
ncbi:MAG: IS110 family RNA-guided transposase [Candidatus Kariarchaeaceae archaeon]|jgi:transposase